MHSNTVSKDPRVNAATDELIAVLWKHGERAGKSKETLKEFFCLMEKDLEIENIVEHLINEY